MFRNEIFRYINKGDELVREPFQRLIEREALLSHKCTGFWQCMDTFKDKQHLEELNQRDAAPWRISFRPLLRFQTSRQECWPWHDLCEIRPRTAGPLQVLCLGCHSDDIEIGCGGAILKFAAEHPDCTFHWVVFSAVGERAAEAQQSAKHFVDPSRINGPILKTFRDGFMPFVGAEIKTMFEDLKQAISPDLIFTHRREDAHQDHRLISELTWNTFRKII